MIEQWMWLIWLLMVVLSLIIEASTAALVSLWFAIGGAAALVASLISGVPYWGEIIVFVGVSIIAFFALRPLIKKVMSKKEQTRSNVEGLIGKKGIVLSPCSYLHKGEIMIDGLTWTAEVRSEGLSFEPSEVALIVAIAGNKLIIDKANGQGGLEK